MSLELFLTVSAVIATALTSSSIIASVNKVVRNRKIKRIKEEHNKINERLLRNEAKIEDLLNELGKIKNEIKALPDSEISKDDREKLESAIDEVIERYFAD